MLSRNGRSTINYYKVFQRSLLDSSSNSLNLSASAGSSQKHKKLLEALSFVPESIFNEKVMRTIQQKDIEELTQIALKGK